MKAAKKDCHPTIVVNQDGTDAQVALQDMFEHTTNRILEDEDVAEMITADSMAQADQGGLQLKATVKIGFDGLSMLPMTKNQGANLGKDMWMLGSWFCFIQLVGNVNGKDKPYYHNSLCLSEASCRPLRLWNVRETPETSQEEYHRLLAEIAALLPLKWSNLVTIICQVKFSMVDQKLALEMVFITGTKRCPVCGLVHSEWKDTKQEDFEINEFIIENLAISITHFGINAWKHMINLGYRVTLGHYYIREEELHIKIAQKTHIQDRFMEVGLLIDMVEPGKGSTLMDGNTARSGFAMPDFAGEVFGFPSEIIKGFGDLWLALKSPIRIPPAAFLAKAQELKRLYYEKLPWAIMPPTLHKVIDHGHLFLEKVPATMSLSMFSEENLEASHKTLRRDFLRHARQFGRNLRLNDIMERKINCGDPVILGPDLQAHHGRKDGDHKVPEWIKTAVATGNAGDPMDLG